MDWFDDFSFSYVGDSVGGLFEGIGDFAEGVGSLGTTAANTAGRVMNAVQDVSSAFNSETLTQRQANNQAMGISSLFAGNNALIIGGLVVGGILLTALILKR